MTGYFISQAKELGQDFAFIFVSGYPRILNMSKSEAWSWVLKLPAQAIDKLGLHQVLSQVAQRFGKNGLAPGSFGP